MCFPVAWTQEQLGYYLGISRNAAKQLVTDRTSDPQLSRVLELVSVGMDRCVLLPELFPPPKKMKVASRQQSTAV